MSTSKAACFPALLAASFVAVPALAQRPSAAPAAERAVPAETTAAAVRDRNWKAPRTCWGHPSL